MRDAEAQEVERVRLGQRDEIGLGEARREAGGGPVQSPRRIAARTSPGESIASLYRARRVPTRWGAIAAYAGVAAANQLLWLTFAPITTATAEHYGVCEGAVGWLSQVFPLLYVLLAIPAGIALDRGVPAGAAGRRVADRGWAAPSG